MALRTLGAAHVLLALATLVSACDVGSGHVDLDGGTSAPDASVLDDAAIPDPVTPDPPAAPAPVVVSCPSGWTGSGPGCTPWDRGAPACTGATMRVPGEPACRPVSRDCTGADYATALPADAIYVSASAAGSGDGTLAHPFATVADALAAAPAGAVVALSRGTHRVSGGAALRVSLLGACAGDTILEAAPDARFDVTTGPLTIADLTFHPGDGDDAIVAAGADAVLDVHGVVLEGGHGVGIASVDHAQVTLADVVVRDVATNTDDGVLSLTAGIAVVYASLTGRRVVLERNLRQGAYADGATLSLTDSVVRATRDMREGDIVYSGGVSCRAGGPLALTRMLFEDDASRGVDVADCPVTLTDLALRNEAFGVHIGGGTTHATRLTFDACLTRAISAEDGESLFEDVTIQGRAGIDGTGGHTTVRRAALRDSSILVSNWGELDLEDVSVDGGHDRYDGREAIRAAGTHGHARLTRVALRDAVDGIQVGGAGGSVTGTDVTIDDVTGAAIATFERDGVVDLERVAMHRVGQATRVDLWNRVFVHDLRVVDSGGGVESIGGGVRITRYEVSGTSTRFGVRSNGLHADVRVEDAYLHDVGAAFDVSDDGNVDVVRATVERVASGVLVSRTSASSGTLTDVTMRDLEGPGVAITSGELTATRTRIVRASGAAIAVHGAMATLHVDDVDVADVRGRPSDGLYGRGLDVAEGASVDGAVLSIEGARGAGLLATGRSTRVSLGDVTVIGTRADGCESCDARPPAHGVAVLDRARVEIARPRVTGSGWVGIATFTYGTLALSDGRVDHNEVGRAQLGATDALSSTGVTYDANGTLEVDADVTAPMSTPLE